MKPFKVWVIVPPNCRTLKDYALKYYHTRVQAILAFCGRVDWWKSYYRSGHRARKITIVP